MKIFKIEFNIPKKSEVAILDHPGSDLIKKTLDKDKFPIISLRSTKINLYILFLSIFENYKYKKGQKYIISYLRFVKPKVVISHIDNNNFFFSLKKIFPHINFIFIQNGTSLADYTNNEIKKLNWKTDYFFSYSKSFSKIYSSIFKNKVITIGSFKNNLIRINTDKKNKNLVFISQFTKSNCPNEFIKSGKNLHSRDIFYKAEKILIPILYNFCQKKKIKFVVSGRNFANKNSFKEKLFYKKILSLKKNGKSSFAFKNLKDDFSSYDLIDKAQLVVFIDSALGYQSLARGNKSLACCIRSSLIKNKNLKFGWPAQFKNEGPFWVNNFNRKKIEKKLEVLYNFSNSKWKKVYKKHRNNLLVYDKENLTFKKTIKKLVK